MQRGKNSPLSILHFGISRFAFLHSSIPAFFIENVTVVASLKVRQLQLDLGVFPRFLELGFEAGRS
jgi:hypothetical protein